jgi:hypothetical protein
MGLSLSQASAKKIQTKPKFDSDKSESHFYKTAEVPCRHFASSLHEFFF